MKHRNSPYIKISSLFTKSVIVLFVLILIINVILFGGILKNETKVNVIKMSEMLVPTLEAQGNAIILKQEGKDLLTSKKMWLQMVDQSLKEVLSYNKPADVPLSYSPIEFIQAYKYEIGNSSVFIFEKEIEGVKYSYLLGVPVDLISKYSIQYSASTIDNLYSGKGLLIIGINGLLIVLFSYFYFSRKIGLPLEKIIDSIVALSQGDYGNSLSEKGLYKGIHKYLNELSATLKQNKVEKASLDQLRERWIAYISHDMKTPLSSIKGFAEIMKAEEYSFTETEIREYSSIMWDKAEYLEDLIEDLNLIQKLKNSVIPLHIGSIGLSKLIENLSSEILLDRRFLDRQIQLKELNQEFNIKADAKLLKRALANFIINFLIYNDQDSSISIEIVEKEEHIVVKLRDTGRGILPEELPNIFEQYYRGTNTSTNPKGSGLGMAIGYEIIKLHQGDCKIESVIGEGTQLSIILPKNF